MNVDVDLLITIFLSLLLFSILKVIIESAVYYLMGYPIGWIWYYLELKSTGGEAIWHHERLLMDSLHGIQREVNDLSHEVWQIRHSIDPDSGPVCEECRPQYSPPDDSVFDQEDKDFLTDRLLAAIMPFLPKPFEESLSIRFSGEKSAIDVLCVNRTSIAARIMGPAQWCLKPPLPYEAKMDWLSEGEQLVLSYSCPGLSLAQWAHAIRASDSAMR